MRVLVQNSDQRLPYHATTIYSFILDNLPTAESHRRAEMFRVLGALAGRMPDFVRPRTAEFLPLILNALASTDIEVQCETVDVISVMLCGIPPDQSAPHVADVVTVLHECANRSTELPPDDYQARLVELTAGQAVIQLAYIVGTFGMADLLVPALADIATVAKRPAFVCTGCAATALLALTDMIAGSSREASEVTALTEQIVNRLIDSITVADSDDVVSTEHIQQALADLMKKCGVEILGGRHTELLTRATDVLIDLIEHNVGEDLAKAELLRPIADIFVLLAHAPSSQIAEQVVAPLVPFLTRLLSSPNASVKSFAIDIFAELFAKKSSLQMMAREFRVGLFDMVVGAVATGPATVATAAANFLATLARHEDGRPLVEERVADCLDALVTRLAAAEQLTSVNIGLREAIVHACAFIGQAILREAFPRDEILPIMLRVLPLRKFPAMADAVYRFVNDAQPTAPDELQGEFVRIYSWLFARSESQIISGLQISSIVVLAAALKLENALTRVENGDAALVSALDGDEYRIACFQAVYPVILGRAQCVRP
jgi:hypothetical protein